MSMWKMDGWKNILTGLGMKNRDKKVSSTLEWSGTGQNDVESHYAMSDIAEKIVDYVVEEAFKKEVRFLSKDDNDEFNEEIHEYLKTFSFFPNYVQAAKYGRLYGAGFLVFGAQDSKMPNDELNKEGIRSIDYLTTLHRYDLHPTGVETDLSSKFFRTPKGYSLQGVSVDGGRHGGEVHPSRMIRFDGAFLPDLLYRSNNYYHDSVLTKVMDKIRDYDASFESVATLLQDFSQAKFKMKNLSNLLASGKEDLVMKRLELIDMKRSLVRAVVLDEGEEFSRDTVNFTGVSDILGKFGEKLTAASNMPHTILLGEGSSGSLSGEGNSEMKNWYDFVKKKQMNEYKPTLVEAVKIMLLAKDSPTKGKISEGFDLEFPPLEELSEKENAEVYKITAEGDEKYIVNQVLDPDEVAINRFSGRQFNQSTTIDIDEREKSLKEPKEPIEEDKNVVDK